MAPLWHSRDERLVEEVRQGRSQAFEQLYARHQPAILSFCRHLTGHREDAEDAVQHTFLSAYCQIAESDGALELRPWLFTVARNRCLSLLRARKARGTVALDDADRASDGLAVEVEQRQELRELVDDLSRLPEQQRAALLLAELDDMSHREIGGVLGVAPAKVKALVFQARSSLASTREARDASCSDIRSQLAIAHGSALRRRKLRRHVHECDGCRTFESIVLGQRRDLAILLPVAPSIGLREAILNSLPGRDAGMVASAGGAAAASAASGGAAGGGIAGSLTAIGTQGAAKLAVAGVVAVGGTGATAADLPDRVQHAASASDVASPRQVPRRFVALEGGHVPVAVRPPAIETPQPSDGGPAPPERDDDSGVGAEDHLDADRRGAHGDRQPEGLLSEGASLVPDDHGSTSTLPSQHPPSNPTGEEGPSPRAPENDVPKSDHAPPSSPQRNPNAPSASGKPDDAGPPLGKIDKGSDADAHAGNANARGGDPKANGNGGDADADGGNANANGNAQGNGNGRANAVGGGQQNGANEKAVGRDRRSETSGGFGSGDQGGGPDGAVNGPTDGGNARGGGEGGNTGASGGNGGGNAGSDHGSAGGSARSHGGSGGGGEGGNPH